VEQPESGGARSSGSRSPPGVYINPLSTRFPLTRTGGSPPIFFHNFHFYSASQSTNKSSPGAPDKIILLRVLKNLFPLHSAQSFLEGDFFLK
jgi:hypothetical protein